MAIFFQFASIGLYFARMKIIEGGLPEDKAWRALVLLSPGEKFGISWQLALSLARANNGEVVAAIIVPTTDPGYLAKASETLSRARKLCRQEDPVYTAIVQDNVYRNAARQLVHLANIDLLLTSSETPGWQSLNRISCAVAVVRGELYNPLFEGAEAAESATGQRPIAGILVPTSGGPNSAYALGFLLPLAQNHVTVRALYVALEHLGSNEEALGRSRLRQTLAYIDAEDHIESELISSASVGGGIVGEAGDGIDIVMIGASRESQLDKTLFGNIPDTVISQSHRPVVVVREPISRLGSLSRQAGWAIQPFRLNLKKRTQAYVRIRRDARPDLDFYVLTGLAAAIAALGLLANSAAVVIGAMLVAPLMSPIAGSGLAMVQGDTRFLRLALGAASRGALLALLMGILAGLVPLKDPMTAQVLTRTQPSLLDVGVALLSGMAVAYALCRSEATAALPGVAIAAALVPPLASAGISLSNGFFPEFGGALLLFLTNFVAIASSAAVMFLFLGFRPTSSQKDRRAVRSRSARLAIIGLILVISIVAYTTYRLGQESAFQAHIRQLAETGVTEITGGILNSIEINEVDDILELDLVVRSPNAIPYSKVIEIQEYMATDLQREVATSMTVIRTTQLDSFNPPTLTPTPTPTPTLMLSPTAEPTHTATPLPSNTPIPEPTDTATPTQTLAPTQTDTATPTATPTITPSPTRPSRIVDLAYGLNFRAEPSADAELLGFLESGTVVTILDGVENNDEGTWQQIQVNDLVGWVLSQFLGDL